MYVAHFPAFAHIIEDFLFDVSAEEGNVPRVQEGLGCGDKNSAEAQGQVVTRTTLSTFGSFGHSSGSMMTVSAQLHISASSS